MKVLVTGGAGFVGSVLIPRLLASGYKVRCLERFFFGRDSLKDVESDPNLEIIGGDTRTIDSSVFRGVSTVIDLAAVSQPDATQQIDSALFHSINQQGPINVATLSKKYGVERYVLSSTCSVYGFQEGILSENSPTKPMESYGKTKVEAEKGVLALADRNFCVTVLRFATAYGLSPKMRFDLAINGMVLALFKTGTIRVMKDGTQWRPFIHVKDFAKVLQMVIEAGRDQVCGKIFNGGSNDQNFQIYPLAKLVGDSIGASYKTEWYGELDTRSYRVDFSNLRRVLGFKADYTPKNGAKEIFKALKEGKTIDSEKTDVIKWYKHLVETHAV